MANFAELDEQNTVVRVVVISNADILDENGVEQEELGVALCNQHVGTGKWVQTSFNHNFRKMFGNPGFIYVEEADVFYDPVSPYPSWSLNSDYDWQAPIPQPTDGKPYYWDEDSLTWVEASTEETQS